MFAPFFLTGKYVLKFNHPFVHHMLMSEHGVGRNDLPRFDKMIQTCFVHLCTVLVLQHNANTPTDVFDLILWLCVLDWIILLVVAEV